MTSEEQRGYSKGYQAGKRWTKRELNREIALALKEDFVQRMMIAIAPQVISRPWGRTVNGAWKSDSGAKQIMKTVRSIAHEAAELCSFVATSALEARQGRAGSIGEADDIATAEGRDAQIPAPKQEGE